MIAALLERHGAAHRRLPVAAPRLVGRAGRGRRAARCTDERFAAAIARAAEAAALVDRTLEPGDRVTQFEALTAAAYWELARAGVEVAVVEAGLGGRYDATSVIRSDVQVLTNVSLEHTRWLGPTERHIAEEKLAVVPAGGTRRRGPRSGAEALRRWRSGWQPSAARGCCCSGATSTIREDVPLRPRGAFQRENFAVAVAAAEAFPAPLDPAHVRAAARVGAHARPARGGGRRPAHDPRRRAQPGRRARARGRARRRSSGSARWWP